MGRKEQKEVRQGARRASLGSDSGAGERDVNVLLLRRIKCRLAEIAPILSF
jgi:hypothetical protein